MFIEELMQNYTILKTESRSYPCNFHTCKICWIYRSKSAFVMYNHVKQHETRTKIDTFLCDLSVLEVYGCKYCEHGTDLKVNLKEHLKTFHEGKRDNGDLNLKCYACEKCGFQTYSLLVLLKHMNTCKYINYTYKTVRRNMQYGKVVKKKGVRYFCCLHCAYKSKWKLNYLNHVSRRHTTPSEDTWFQCKYCKYGSKDKWYFKKHTNRKHGDVSKRSINDKRLECEQCNYETESSKSLAAHMKRKHTPAILKVQSEQYTEQFECKYCPFKANNRQILESHINWVHVSVSDAMHWRDCKHCNSQTASNIYQKQQVNGKNINWSRCGHCDYKSIPRRNLRKRKLTKSRHTEQYVTVPFECKHCNFTAENVRISSRHINCMHTPVTNSPTICFHCEHCRFKTNHKHDLLKHIRTHTIAGDFATNGNWCEHNYFKILCT